MEILTMDNNLRKLLGTLVSLPRLWYSMCEVTDIITYLYDKGDMHHAD